MQVTVSVFDDRFHVLDRSVVWQTTRVTVLVTSHFHKQPNALYSLAVSVGLLWALTSYVTFLPRFILFGFVCCNESH